MPTRFEQSRAIDRNNGSAGTSVISGSTSSVRRSGNDIDLKMSMLPAVLRELKEQVMRLRWQMSTGWYWEVPAKVLRALPRVFAMRFWRTHSLRIGGTFCVPELPRFRSYPQPGFCLTRQSRCRPRFPSRTQGFAQRNRHRNPFRDVVNSNRHGSKHPGLKKSSSRVVVQL